jgi:hypothetical protein
MTPDAEDRCRRSQRGYHRRQKGKEVEEAVAAALKLSAEEQQRTATQERNKLTRELNEKKTSLLTEEQKAQLAEAEDGQVAEPAVAVCLRTEATRQSSQKLVQHRAGPQESSSAARLHSIALLEFVGL